MVKKIYMGLMLGLLSGIQMQGAATGEPRGQKRTRPQAAAVGASESVDMESADDIDAAAVLATLAQTAQEDAGLKKVLDKVRNELSWYKNQDTFDKQRWFILYRSEVEILNQAARKTNFKGIDGYKNWRGSLFNPDSNIGQEYYNLRANDVTSKQIFDAVGNRCFSRISKVTYPEYVVVKMHEVLQEQCKDMDSSMTLEQYLAQRREIAGKLYDLLIVKFFHTFSAYHCEDYLQHSDDEVLKNCQGAFEQFLDYQKNNLLSGNVVAKKLILDLQKMIKQFISSKAMNEVKNRILVIIRLLNYEKRYGRSCIDTFFTSENFETYKILDHLKKIYSREKAQEIVLNEDPIGAIVPAGQGGAPVDGPQDPTILDDTDSKNDKAPVAKRARARRRAGIGRDSEAQQENGRRKRNNPWQSKYVESNSQAAGKLDGLQNNRISAPIINKLEKNYAGQENVEEQIALQLIEQLFNNFGMFNLRMYQNRSVQQFYFDNMKISFEREHSSLVKQVYKDLAEIICSGNDSVRNMIFNIMECYSVPDEDAPLFFGQDNFNRMGVKEVLLNKYLQSKKKPYSGPINFSSFVYRDGGAPVQPLGSSQGQASQGATSAVEYFEDADYYFEDSSDETESE